MIEINKLLASFLNEQDINNYSREVYKSNLKPFWIYIHINKLDINKLDRTNIINYKSYLSNKFKSAYTIRNYFTAVCLLYRFMEQKEMYANITANIKPMRLTKEITKMPLNRDQVNNLLNSFDLNTPKGLRDYTIIYTMLILGLRVDEATKLKVGDIEQFGNSFTIKVNGKGMGVKKQQIRLPTELYDKIESYLITRTINEDSYLFERIKGGKLHKRTLQYMIKKKLLSVGLTGHNYSSHSLRHTTATILIELGKPLEQVRDHLRHANTKTSEKYINYITKINFLNSQNGSDLMNFIEKKIKEIEKKVEKS